MYICVSTKEQANRQNGWSRVGGQARHVPFFFCHFQSS
jgi:hypothetical protein